MYANLRSLLIVLLVAPMASAQEPSRAEIIKRIKAATAFVQADERSQGSSFCVHASGLFLTNEHVVRNAKEITLVLNPGLATQELLTAKVIRFDAALDLAVLKVDKKVTCAPLALGSSAELVEQNDVILAGYPFGKDLALENGEYPSISINAGKISALRLKNNELERIQVDAVVNQGNSGGPVLDAKGKVVGVVVSGVRGATVNFAIPVDHVHRFISAPEIEIQKPSVAYADRFKAAAFRVRTLPLLPTTSPYDVELILRPRDGEERTVAMALEKGMYRVVAAPLPSPKGPALLTATLYYSKGNVSGMVADRAFKLGGNEIKLAAVRSVRFGPEVTVVLTNDKIFKGPLTGLDEISLQLGSDTMQLNPTKAVELAIAPPNRDTGVEYTVIVRSGGKELARVRDTLAFRDPPSTQPVPAKGNGPLPSSQKLDGFWVLEQTESRSKTAWPQGIEEAIYIEGNKVLWVKKDAKLPINGLEADLEYVAGKNPQQVTFSLKRGRADGQKWQVIYKIEGNLLTIATNCDEDRCPTLFTVRETPGSGQFVRTYRRIVE